MGCKTWRNYDIIRHSRLIVLSHESNGHYTPVFFFRAAACKARGRACVFFATLSVSRTMARKSFWWSDYTHNTWSESPLQPIPFSSGCGIQLSNARSGVCGTLSAPFGFFSCRLLGSTRLIPIPLVGGSGDKLKPFRWLSHIWRSKATSSPWHGEQLRKVTSGLESHICKYQIPMARQVSRTSPWVGQSSRNITQTGAAFELQKFQLLDDFLLAQPSWLLSAYQRKNLEILMAHALQVIIKLCSALLLSAGTA